MVAEQKREQKTKTQTKADFILTVGRRKKSIARVFLREGSGKIRVNKRSLEDYFPRESHRLIINQPIKTVKLENKLDIAATLNGGGISGQAQALKHGISRAIVKFDENQKSAIKKAGFLTRDPRAKERKKYGRKRARKRFQYSKR
ncbi:MAG: 30S ribosomal protein S9 [Candidatus Omnitrophica bacterium]|nr:30S ribosomal protein S9 [Candidatus Omnitrophota bacterium]